jgi:type I restriction enzyme S subunit
MVAPTCKLILNLQRTNQNLKQTRDLLLPHLISGEIDVSTFDTGNAEPAA